MSKQNEFINWVQGMIDNNSYHEPNEEAKLFWEALKNSPNTTADKPDFTDNGKMILKQLQDMPAAMYKARDIAEALFVAPKMVAGSMRKLVTDGYVEKIGKDPSMYTITEKGKNVIFEE